MEPRTRIATRSYGSPPPLPAERRSESRTTCHMPVLLEAGGRALETVLWDVSISGAFVECSQPLAERQRVRLYLTVPTLMEPIAVRAEVRWVLLGPAGDMVGAGVRFDGMHAHEMRAWIRHLRTLA